METILTASSLRFFEPSPKDTPALERLHKESFGVSAWAGEQLARSLPLATTYAVAATHGTTLYGFILCQHVSEDAEILTFCVAPDARQRGIGFSLLQTTRNALKQKGAQRIMLDVAADNAPALALYEKAGFQRRGIRKGYYKRINHTVDAVMMEILL